MRGLKWGSDCRGGEGCEERAVVFGAGAGVDEGLVREGDGVYGVFWSERRGESGAGCFVRVVEEEGAPVGVPNVVFREGFACGGVGGEGEGFVVVWRGGAFWHGYRWGRGESARGWGWFCRPSSSPISLGLPFLSICVGDR